MRANIYAYTLTKIHKYLILLLLSPAVSILPSLFASLLHHASRLPPPPPPLTHSLSLSLLFSIFIYLTICLSHLALLLSLSIFLSFSPLFSLFSFHVSVPLSAFNLLYVSPCKLLMVFRQMKRENENKMNSELFLITKFLKLKPKSIIFCG